MTNRIDVASFLPPTIVMRPPGRNPLWSVAGCILLAGCGSGSSAAGIAAVNRPPTAVLTGPASGGLWETIALDGSGSTDPEGSLLTSRWTMTSRPVGSTTELQSTGLLASFVADLPGTYQVSLIVNDGEHDSEPATRDVVAVGGADIGPWQSTTGLESFSTDGAHDSAAFAVDGWLYVSGGQYGTRDRIQRAPIHADGTLGAWVDMVTLTPPAMMPSPNQDHLALVATSASGSARVYVIGGWNGSALGTVFHAPILGDGSIGAWVAGPNLARSRHGHGGVVLGNRILVFGGWSGGALDSTEQATLAAGGSFASGWTSATELPQALTFPTAVVDAGSTFPGPWVLGGENPAACPNTAQASVYRGHGSPMGWQLAGALPEPLLDAGVVLTNDTLCVIGGAHRVYPSSNPSCVWQDAQVRSGVHLATVLPTGQISPWRAGPALPAPRADHSTVVHRDHVYVVGGRSVALDAPYPTAVWFARLR